MGTSKRPVAYRRNANSLQKNPSAVTEGLQKFSGMFHFSFRDIMCKMKSQKYVSQSVFQIAETNLNVKARASYPEVSTYVGISIFQQLLKITGGIDCITDLLVSSALLL
jgi:hypothetical protein